MAGDNEWDCERKKESIWARMTGVLNMYEDILSYWSPH